MSNSMVSDVGQSNTLYLSIANGNIVKKCKESDDDPRIRAREWEHNGKTGVSYEIPFKDLNGYITKISVQDGKYGAQCVVDMAKGTDKVQLKFPFESNYFTDFVKRVAGADLSKPVTLNAYSFEDDNGKLKQGITVIQEGEKLKNFFYDVDKGESLHGIPNTDDLTEAQRKKMTTSKWKIFFAQERDFLGEYLENLEFSDYNQLPGDSGSLPMTSPQEAFDAPEEPTELPEGVEKLPWEK